MRLLIIILSIVGLLVSCAQVPKQGSAPLSYQKKLQASAHWNQMAEQISHQVKKALINQFASPDEKDRKEEKSISTGEMELVAGKPLEQTSTQGCEESFMDRPPVVTFVPLGPVFIQNYDLSPFGSAFRTLLTTKLLNKGISVSPNEQCPYKLDWEIGLVTHEAERVNKGGLLTFLLEIPQFVFFGENDWHEYKPHSEVLITFMLKHNKVNVLVRDSRIYYINDEDVGHYRIAAYAERQKAAEPTTFTVVSE